MATLVRLFLDRAPDDTAQSKLVLRDTLIEFASTAAFVYFGTLSAASTLIASNEDGGNAGSGSDAVTRILLVSVAFGMTISGLVYSVGHISGGHMNPAVSLLVFLRREMSYTKMMCYWLGQFAGSVLGSALVWGGTTALQANGFLLGATTLHPFLSTWNGFLLELMGSCFFFFVIAQTALAGDRNNRGGISSSNFPPLVIGMSLIVVHICLVPFTGCGVNPARTFGPSAVDCMAGRCAGAVGPWYWIYFVGPFLASFLVAEVTCWLGMSVDDNHDAGANVEKLSDQENTSNLDEPLPVLTANCGEEGGIAS